MTEVVPLIPGAQRQEFDFTPFKFPVTHGGVMKSQKLAPPYDVSCEQLLVRLPTDHGGIVQPPLNFRGVFDVNG